MTEALAVMDPWKEDADEDSRQQLRAVLRQIEAQQNEYKRIWWGPVRIIP